MADFIVKNWKVSDDGIEWIGEGGGGYFIERTRLLENRDNMYDWLVHLPGKTWLNREDVYALNTAYIYAMEKFGIPFDTLSFVKTFEVQDDELGLKDEE